MKFKLVDQAKAAFPITRLCQLLGVSPSGYFAFARPDDRCSPLLHADFSIDTGDVVAHGIARQRKFSRDPIVVEAAADEHKHFALALCEIARFARQARLRRAKRCQLLDDVAAEPRRILHDGVQRGDQLDLRSPPVRDVLDYPEDARIVADRDRRRRDEAVEQRPVLRLDPRLGLLEPPCLVERVFETTPGCGRVPQSEVARRVSDDMIVVVTGHRVEGCIGVQHAVVFKRGHDHRDRRKAERAGKSLLAMPQCRFRPAARLEIGEGEKHARHVTEHDRLAGYDHQLATTIGQIEFGLHLRHRLASREAALGEFAVGRVLKDVELIKRPTHDRVVVVAGHVEKALVDPQETQVAEAADESRGRVSVESLVEITLGLLLRGVVADDERDALRLAFAIGQDQAADVVDPFRPDLSGAGHFDSDTVERLASRGAFDRKSAGSKSFVAAIGQFKAASELAYAGAEICQRFRAVHRERGVIRPQDRLIWRDQHDSLIEVCDNTL